MKCLRCGSEMSWAEVIPDKVWCDNRRCMVRGAQLNKDHSITVMLYRHGGYRAPIDKYWLDGWLWCAPKEVVA